MKLLVTKIEFDFDDDDFVEWEGLSLDEQIAITNDNLGIWEVDNVTNPSYVDSLLTSGTDYPPLVDTEATHDSEGC